MLELYLAIAECKRLMSTQVNEDDSKINILKEAESVCQVAYVCVRSLKPFSETEKESRRLPKETSCNSWAQYMHRRSSILLAKIV